MYSAVNYTLMPILILLQFIDEYADELLCALFRV